MNIKITHDEFTELQNALEESGIGYRVEQELQKVHSPNDEGDYSEEYYEALHQAHMAVLKQFMEHLDDPHKRFNAELS